MRKVFIDCGAHKGESYAKFLRDVKDHELWGYYSFEANPGLDCPTPNLIRKAVWVEDGRTYLFKGAHDDLTLGYTIMSDAYASIEKVTPYAMVYTIDFSRWVRENFSKDDHIELKLNIEGAEFAVLKKMIDEGTIDYINRLYVHWHSMQYDHRGLITPILKDIKERGIPMDFWDITK